MSDINKITYKFIENINSVLNDFLSENKEDETVRSNSFSSSSTRERERQILEVISGKENPFVKIDGKVWVRFDSIQFENKGNCIRASYCYRGNALYYIDLGEKYGIALSNNDSIILEGIEGRAEVDYPSDWEYEK